MKALKSELAKRLLADPQGAAAVRDFTSGAPREVLIDGVKYILRVVPKAR